MSSSLLGLIDWLKGIDCQCAAMEATGSYWKPIYNLLEMEGIHTLVVNAQHIKLASVISEIDSKSSRDMLDMLVAGCVDVQAMANKARRQMRKKIPQIEEALQGFMGEHQRIMLRLMLKHIDILAAQVLSLDEEIQQRIKSTNEQVSLVDSIPGLVSVAHKL